MSGPVIIALGTRLRPLEYVAAVGAFLGLPKATAYRAAVDWPTTGGEGQHRRVIVPRLLDELGIPYSCETGGDDA